MTGPQIGERISEYVLDEQVGAGSFGQVWKAHHHIWKDTIVAIKVPTDSQFVRNLQKEGLTIHGLKHPNIVHAIGLDPYAPIPYLVMEYVDGRSLREVVAEHPSGMPIRAVELILCGMLQALEHAHQNGVIHRDIKPENILIADGRKKPAEEIAAEDVKVTDFGLGRAGEITTASILQSGSLLSEEGRSISGTLAYMAPEQRDAGETDERSDLYSIGVVLFEMLCGGRPSGSDLPSQVREGLPSWVDLVYSRLYTRRERRFANATAALQALAAASVPPIIGSGLRPSPVPRATAAGSRRVRGCDNCGEFVEPGDSFCIMCGWQVVAALRRCLKCGAYPAAEDRYCVFCGAALPAGVE